MRLTQLQPELIRFETKREECDMVPLELRGAAQYDAWKAAGRPFVREMADRVYHVPVEAVAEAQGIMFLCPQCFKANGGPVGTHAVMIAFEGRGVLDHEGSRGTDGPTRWQVSGDSLENLTTTPSILLSPPGCGWHGYLTNGEATFC